MRPWQVLAARSRGACSTALRICALALSLSLSVALGATAVAAPAPCNGVLQISDDAGDGHHANTDVLSAWFSQQAGRLQVVVRTQLGDWMPAHEDSAAAGWAVVFTVGGQQRYVRAEGPRVGPPRYDYGSWSLGGGFASAGVTGGEVVAGTGGTVTIDIPPASGAVAGSLLARPFVLTYDGMASPSAPHWVDRAPGGVTPGEAAFGADYSVIPCQGGGASGGGPATGGGPGPSPDGAATTTGVTLYAAWRRIGAGRIRAGGRITPARGGVVVRIRAQARHSRKAALVRRVTTLTDGSFAVAVPLSESSTVTAVAEGVNAQTRTVTVRSTVRLTLRRVRGARTRASGVVNPRLAGRVLLLRTNAVVPSASVKTYRGRFRIAARRLLRGRYQAVFIPSGKRADRSTSRTGVVR